MAAASSSSRRKRNRDEEVDILQKYTIDRNEKLGAGGFGNVFLANNNATGEEVACKIVKIGAHPLPSRQQVEHEANILKTLNYASIIKVWDHCPGKSPDDGNKYFIFMELASGGELFAHLGRNNNCLEENEARRIFMLLVDGVAHCQREGVAHLDLKFENVMLTEEDAVKIVDFGLAHIYPKNADRSIDRSTKLQNGRGSRAYAAPEVMQRKPYDGFEADMYSLGVMLFTMIAGFFPCTEQASPLDRGYETMQVAQENDESSARAIFALYRLETLMPQKFSPAAMHVVDQLLMIDPTRRMTMDELQEHAWLTGETFAAPPAYRSLGAAAAAAAPVYQSLGAAAPVFRSLAAAPVYRSCAAPPPTEPPPMPTPLTRQLGCLDLDNPPEGVVVF